MSLKITKTAIPDLFLLEHKIYGDERGFFYESFNAKEFEQATGLKETFVQDNHSRSVKSVLRGLHYQVENTQGKLVRVTLGSIFDVAVDIRLASPTFGQWVGFVLDDKARKSLWVPKGFAHGFLVITPFAEVQYKTTDYYNPQAEKTLRWNDPHLKIAWPLEGEPILSSKDSSGLTLKEVEAYQ